MVISESHLDNKNCWILEGLLHVDILCPGILRVEIYPKEVTRKMGNKAAQRYSP
jgi:hypothetical protein